MNLIQKLILKIAGLDSRFSKLEKAESELLQITERHKEQEYQKEYFFTDKFGNKYYRFLDGQAPRTRIQVIQQQFPLINLGFTKDVIRDYINSVSQNCYNILAGQNVRENTQETLKKTQLLEERINFAIQGEPELKVALAYFLLEDEPDQYSVHHAKKKRQIWTSDPETLAFFLCEVLKAEKIFSDLSTSTVLEHLTKNGIMKEMINK